MDYTLDNVVKCVCESMGLTGKFDHSLQEQNTYLWYVKEANNAVNRT